MLKSARPQMLIFFADWSEPCVKLAKQLCQHKKQNQKQIDFVAIDSEDSANEALLDRFEIVRLPTVVSLDGGNHVIDMQDGYSGEDQVRQMVDELKKAERNPSRAKPKL